MKIALLGPVAWRTPPRAYGPWEQVVSLLAEGLVARGVDVTLFATLDSRTAARLEGVCARPYNEDGSLDGRVWEALHTAHCYERSGGFDLVHNNLDWLPLAMSGFCRTRLLTTVHGFSDRRILPAYRRSNSAFVSISNADRAPELDYVATVHHGIDLAQFPVRLQRGGPLVAFGRIHPDKATADAIEIARRARRTLIICGPIHDERYHTERVLPHVDGENVRYLGNVGPTDRARILGEAAALLHPLGFDEPFGLSVVEAMACGTPVVGYPRGALPETVDHGVTGFLVDGIGPAAEAVADAESLDRSTVADVARRRFSAARMVDEYLTVYEKLLG
ncbi:glycosyl transferase [Virgisporangium aliadipatigenens]|uniref:Glycosyl transferase n=1 Tax=Virgisporangium aliadipatigenens TaxID=741659 RepID=A0A8J3YNE9_9ACTN|nr:glycosyltransferase family 4 protein [Virgisporangium aliadipatigenens]GIJ47557.1 glycosyl transferase [Virgisporangium aliadipatigenens]